MCRVLFPLKEGPRDLHSFNNLYNRAFDDFKRVRTLFTLNLKIQLILILNTYKYSYCEFKNIATSKSKLDIFMSLIKYTLIFQQFFANVTVGHIYNM